MSHYDDLGVDERASKADLKAAYHRAAKEKHPDAGGDADAFAKVNKAWMVLSDPARRAKYDETGNTEPEPDDHMTVALGLIGSALTEAVSNLPDHLLGRVDVMNVVRKDIATKTRKLAQEHTKGEKARDRYTKLIDRVKHKGDGPNFIANIFRDHRTDVERQLRDLERTQRGLELAGQILEDFDWDTTDTDDDWPRPRFFSGTTSNRE